MEGYKPKRMIFQNEAELKSRIHELTGRSIRGKIQIFEDSTSYMNILGGSILRLEGNDYFVLGDAVEGRFGIDDQPKFWVKYAVDLETGARKVIKLVFHEEFTALLGFVRIRCRRSPKKESEILSLTKDHPRFMQGDTIVDPSGNLIRIIDFIPGKSLYRYLASLTISHEEYYATLLPGIMEQIIACALALDDLHKKGQHHGDVRNDHIIIDNDTNLFRWIDFDYHVNYADYDLWSFGNVVNHVVGMGTHTIHDIRTARENYPALSAPIQDRDLMLLFKNRIGNLAKLFPYIDKNLNEILMRFSAKSQHFYTDLSSLIADLKSLDFVSEAQSP